MLAQMASLLSPVSGKGVRLKEGGELFGQCLLELTTFQKGASLIFSAPSDSHKAHLQQVGLKARKSLHKEQPSQKTAPRISPVGRR